MMTSWVGDGHFPASAVNLCAASDLGRDLLCIGCDFRLIRAGL